ncbi:MAG: hypothetical protein ACKOTZ_00300 [Chloroflexota bacterium]
MHTTSRRHAIAAVAVVLALALPATVAGAEPVQLTIAQQPPEITLHDLAGDGWGAGDLFTFHAVATAGDGRSVTLVGDHQSVVLPA